MASEALSPTVGVIEERRSSLGLLLALLGQDAMRRLRDAHTAHDLMPRQFQLLGLLADHGPMGQRDLGQAMATDPSILVTLLNPLEADGFLTRNRDSADRRRHVVTLTAKGSASSTTPPRHKDRPRTPSSPASTASSAHSCATCSSHCATAATPHQPTKRAPDHASELLATIRGAAQVPLVPWGRSSSPGRRSGAIALDESGWRGAAAGCRYARVALAPRCSARCRICLVATAMGLRSHRWRAGK